MYIQDIEIPIPAYIKLDNELKKQGRSYRWLSNEIDLCYYHTYRLLNGMATLTKKNRAKINKALGTDY
ncbi:MAG: hypothetical protein AABY22_20545 [Nanoarchaeota archaeon]